MLALLILLALWLSVAPVFAVTTFAPGDVAIIGINGDNPDEIAFVVLVDVLAGTELIFTDAGWFSTNTFRTGEGAIRYTFPANTTAGTVIKFTNPAAGDWATITGDPLWTGVLALSNDGDQVFALQASSASPTFIFAAQTNSTTWQTTATNAQTSALPAGLTDGVNAVAVGAGSGPEDEWDNAQYTGPRTGTKAALLAAIADASNWVGNNAFITLDTSNFTISAGGGGASPTIDVPSYATNAPVLGVNQGDTTVALTIPFSVADADTPIASLTVTATSTNTAVLPNANIMLNNLGGGNYNVQVGGTSFVGVGYANITLSVSDGANTTTHTLRFAATSLPSAGPATRYHNGAADASTTVAIDSDYMIVGNDEDQILRVYPRAQSGLPVASFDMTANLALTDFMGGGIPREVDIEASHRVGNRIYWLASHGNSASGNDRPNRSRFFATDISGTGASTSLTFVGYYTDLKADLIAWDAANGHGLGANALGLSASATVGVAPEATGGTGFNIEGMTTSPDGTVMYVAFRAPLQSPATRTLGLIVPVTNFAALVGGSPATGPATFGAVIQLDLGGRGIRSIECNADGCLIVAGTADGGAPNFKLYTWTGNPADAPVERAATLTDLNPEGFIMPTGPLTNSSVIQLVSDNGDNIWYGDGVIAKNLPDVPFRAFRSDLVTLGSGVVLPKIHDIQGSGASFTSAGPWTVEGIVTASYQTTTIRGFFLQEEDADVDADPLTSEGIFVFCNTCPTPVSAGDKVRVVNATASEFFNMTQLSATTAGSVVFVSAGNPLPTVTNLTFPTPTSMSKDDYLEPFEGMLVRINGTLTVTEVYQLGRFGQVTLAPSRLFQFTHNNAPNVANYAAHQTNVSKSTIVLDDNTLAQNPDPVIYPQGNLSMANPLRIGDTIANVTGVLHWSWGGASASPNTWRIRPVPSETYTFMNANARPATPPNVGGTLKVASFNVLNYFNGDGMGGGFPTARGASNATEFTRQRDKIINALATMNADVVGLMEIENDGGANQAIADLVNGLNAAMGAGTYAYIDTGIIGADQIRVALIYKPIVLSPIGSYATLTTPAMQTDCNRPPLAQLFEVTNATHPSLGERFIVMVNHLKSKGSACSALGDSDTGNGEGNGYQARLNGANAILNWIGTDVYFSDPDVLVIGDMNAYPMEAPIQAFVTAGYTDLIRQLSGLSAYSYVFNGESSYLDHALGSASLLPQVTGAGDWHINTDEPLAFDYNLEFKSVGQQASFYSNEPYRSSDHDPVLIGLNLGVVTPPTLTASVAIDGTPLSSGALSNVTGIRVTFDQDVRYTGSLPAPAAGDEADNVANYRLIGEGATPGIQTTFAPDFCLNGTVSGDDVEIVFTSATYTPTTRTTELVIATVSSPLADGQYRLVICGSTSVVSLLSGLALDGNGNGVGGDDALIAFTVGSAVGGVPVNAGNAALDVNNDGVVSQEELLAGITRLPATGETPIWRNALIAALLTMVTLLVAFVWYRRGARR